MLHVFNLVAGSQKKTFNDKYKKYILQFGQFIEFFK
jgi:hypothetical protein